MIEQFEGFVPIHTVFYSIFHPTEGTKVAYEFPPGNLQAHNINFDTIKNYIIPKAQLCHKLLTLKYGKYRLVSYPITINSSLYARNFFSFNFVFVFPVDCETSPYEPIVARLGKMFRVLEEQNQILSRAECDNAYYENVFSLKSEHESGIKKDGTSGYPKDFTLSKKLTESSFQDSSFINSSFSVQDLIMKMYQDLNNYSECLISIDEGNAVDIKIFPSLAPPSTSLSIEDVPIATVNLNRVLDVNWDPTMLKIVPFINGLNSISMIANLSESDINLVLECLKHLVYYQLVIITDIFQFTNIYVPTSKIRTFLTDIGLATDCQTYVTLPKLSEFSNIPFERELFEEDTHSTVNIKNDRYNIVQSGINSNYSIHDVNDSISSGASISNDSTSTFLPTKSCLFDLYRSLSPGVSLKEWYKERFSIIKFNNIDVRRFITFGLVRGLLYRSFSIPIMRNINDLNGIALEANKLSEPRTNKPNCTRSKQNLKMKDNIMHTNNKNTFDIGSNSQKFKSQYMGLGKPEKAFLENNKSERPNSTTNFSTYEKGKRTDLKKKVLLGGQKQAVGISQEIDIINRLLSESLSRAENIDQICTILKKSRSQVEALLENLGDYVEVNC